MKIKDIKSEIIDCISKKHSSRNDFAKILNIIKKEVLELEKTNGLDGKNNLEVFYNIWKSHKNECGHENVINSWTAYFLGMTDKKPDGEFLPFRRAFARAGFPDIDSDFDYEYRDKVYSYIIDKYGRENVGNIGTHGILKFKSCVTRVAKALDLANAYHRGKDAYITENASKVTEILSSFSKGFPIKINDENGEIRIIKNFEEAYKYSHEFRKYVDNYVSQDFKYYLETIEGTFANFGFHAAGIVICDVPIQEIAPLRRAKKGMLATQYPLEDLESIGLIKFDILAIATLTVIRKTVEMVKDYWGIEIDIENIPLNDETTFQLYRDGNLGGVFQCENYGMQKTMMEIGVDRFEDIVAGIALYRPGPMESIPEYCLRKKGLKEISYFHKEIEPFVKPYLESTYGIMSYQEQLMQVCNSLAKFSITDGYVMIKAVGKKNKILLEKFEMQFLEGCISNGIKKEIAKQYWDKFIVPFSSYGFNKCLDGSTLVKNISDNKMYSIEQLEQQFRGGHKNDIYLYSYIDGEIVLDQVCDVFCTGEKEVYEVELNNGMIVKCTLHHKFMCDDGKEYTIEEILRKDLSILIFNEE